MADDKTKWSDQLVCKESAMLSTLPPPQCGHEFRRARIVMSLSARAVAQALGVSHSTLLRWEEDGAELPAATAMRWRQALASCGQQRLRHAERHAVDFFALADTGLAAHIAMLR